MKKFIDTSKTRLYHYSGDMSKKWSISYYVFSEKEGKLVRKFDYEINTFKTAFERYEFSKRKIIEINKLLESGFFIKDDKTKTGKVTIKKAFDVVFEFKSKVLKTRSKNSIGNVLSDFLNVMNENGRLYNDIKTLSKFDLINYQDYLFKKKLSTRTINNYSGYLSALVNDMMERYEYIKNNPFQNIKKFKQIDTIKNRAITDNELDILLPALKQPQNFALFLFVGFVYYCWVRPAEVYTIKVSDIDLVNGKLLVKAEDAKNSKSKYTTIPKPFLELLKQSGIEHQNRNFYIFTLSKTRLYGLERYRRNTFTELHRALCDKLELSKEIVLYSWKRTGVAIGAKNGMSIYQIKTHGRWSDLKQVDTYLKKTGIDLEEQTGAELISKL
jgi:integrase